MAARMAGVIPSVSLVRAPLANAHAARSAPWGSGIVREHALEASEAEASEAVEASELPDASERPAASGRRTGAPSVAAGPSPPPEAYRTPASSGRGGSSLLLPHAPRRDAMPVMQSKETKRAGRRAPAGP